MPCSCSGSSNNETESPSCNCDTSPPKEEPHECKVNSLRYFGIGACAFALCFAVYSIIISLSQWLTYDVFGIGRCTESGAAVEFFFYDTAKILMLLVIMVYSIAWLRATMNVERVRDYLAGKGRGIGYFLGRHSALYQCHRDYSDHGKLVAQGASAWHHSGFLHEHRGSQSAGSTDAQAGYALATACTFPWYVTCVFYIGRMVVQLRSAPSILIL